MGMETFLAPFLCPRRQIDRCKPIRGWHHFIPCCHFSLQCASAMEFDCCFFPVWNWVAETNDLLLYPGDSASDYSFCGGECRSRVQERSDLATGRVQPELFECIKGRESEHQEGVIKAARKKKKRRAFIMRRRHVFLYDYCQVFAEK